ncbi:CAP domain-containing protein [Streptomonospora halophila]
MVAVPAGLGLAAAMVLAAGPPSENPLTQGTQAGAAPAPGADEALPPAPDDFFDDRQSGGAPQDGQNGQGGQEAAPGDPGDAGTGEPEPDAVIEGGATLAPSQRPDDEQDGSESGDGSQDGGSGGGSGSGSGSPDGGSQPSTLAQQVVSIANDRRAEAGCGPLQVDPRLTAASEAHSRDMAERDYMAHENPDGEGPAERAEDAGYGSWSGENVAAGYTSAESVMEGWMDSPGHRANILNCDNTEVGVGETDTKWAQNFGRG